MGLRREYVVNKLKPIDKNFKSESTPKEVIEEVIEEVVQTPPEPIDEVTEVFDEEVVVEEDKSKELEEILKEEENKSDEDKKVICLDTLDVYENAKDASIKTGANAGAITRNCKGYTKKAGGKKWKFYKNYLLELE